MFQMLEDVQVCVFTPRPTPNYQLLYNDLLSACAEYFGVDVDDEQLVTAYNRIFGHMTNTADKVQVQDVTSL